MDTRTTAKPLSAFCLFLLSPDPEPLPYDLAQIAELEDFSTAGYSEWITTFPSVISVEPEEFESAFNWFLA